MYICHKSHFVECYTISVIDENIIGALERLLLRGAGITTRSLSEVHPEFIGLTLAQYRTMTVIASRDGIRIGEIAKRSYTTSPAVTRIIRRLEEKGLVLSEGRLPGEDRRVVLVRLTDTGAALWDDIAVRRCEHLRAAVAEADLPTGARDALEAVADALAAYNPPDTPRRAPGQPRSPRRRSGTGVTSNGGSGTDKTPTADRSRTGR